MGSSPRRGTTNRTECVYNIRCDRSKLPLCHPVVSKNGIPAHQFFRLSKVSSPRSAACPSLGRVSGATAPTDGVPSPTGMENWAASGGKRIPGSSLPNDEAVMLRLAKHTAITTTEINGPVWSRLHDGSFTAYVELMRINDVIIVSR